MESDILESLEQLGYDGPLEDEHVLVKACERGLSSPEYAGLCTWLISELRRYWPSKEITYIQVDGTADLHFEMSKLLKERFCPYPTLLSKDLSEALKNKDNCLKLILYLSSELQAAQIVASKRLHAYECTEESAMAHLTATCRTLKLSEPNGQSAANVLCSIETKLKEVLDDLPKKHLGKPAFKFCLSSEQWGRLEHINSALCVEYKHRRRMLIKRLDVTMQSFGWSERAKFIDGMAKVYQPIRYSLLLKSSVCISHLLAAREDICNMMKTSSGLSRVKTTCAINKVVMGGVPDRGGRPAEIEAPPPEMPAWRKRQDGGGRGGWSAREGGGMRGYRNPSGGRGRAHGRRAEHYFY